MNMTLMSLRMHSTHPKDTHHRSGHTTCNMCTHAGALVAPKFYFQIMAALGRGGHPIKCRVETEGPTGKRIDSLLWCLLFGR